MRVLIVVGVSLMLQGCFVGGTINTVLDTTGDVIDIIVPF